MNKLGVMLVEKAARCLSEVVLVEGSGLQRMCGRPVVRGGLRLRREAECDGGEGRRCWRGAGMGWMSEDCGCGVKSGKF